MHVNVSARGIIPRLPPAQLPVRQYAVYTPQTAHLRIVNGTVVGEETAYIKSMRN